MEPKQVFVALLKWLVPFIAALCFTIISISMLNSHLGGRDPLNLHASFRHTEQHVRAHSTNVSFKVANEVEAFLGPRPDARRYVDAQKILAACNNTGIEGWRDTRHCIDYMRDHEEEYHSIETYNKEFECNSEDPYNYITYWRGPFTWRVSFMIKSFLFTQNLKCSRLTIWLDADDNEGILALNTDSPFFLPFRELVDEGIIALREWHYPDRVYIPPEHQIIKLNGDDHLVFQDHLIPRGAVAVSDSVRFILLHEQGGFYIDMDTIFLRDVRPLLIAPDLNFAERWAAHPGKGEYNTAYLRLQAHSAISSRILQGGSDMGVNFHPRVIGRMLVKTGHELDLVRFETGLFDPLWSEFDRDRTGKCCTPCLTRYQAFFDPHPIPNEWSTIESRDLIPTRSSGNIHSPAGFNRTLATYYRGAYTHHIHNQWRTKIRPYSWAWVADQTYNQFLRGDRVNPYGEKWIRNTLDFRDEEAGYEK